MKGSNGEGVEGRRDGRVNKLMLKLLIAQTVRVSIPVNNDGWLAEASAGQSAHFIFILSFPNFFFLG